MRALTFLLIQTPFLLLARAQSYLSANEMLAQYPPCARGFWAQQVIYPMAESCGVSPSTTPTQSEAQCLCLAGACDSTINATLCAEFYANLGLQLNEVCTTTGGVCDFTRAQNFIYSDYCYNVHFEEVEEVVGDGFMDAYQVSTTLPAVCAGASAGAGSMPSFSTPAGASALPSGDVIGISFPVGTQSVTGAIVAPSTTSGGLGVSQFPSGAFDAAESSASSSAPTLPEDQGNTASSVTQRSAFVAAVGLGVSMLGVYW